MAAEQWGVVANVRGDRVFRDGARVWIVLVPGSPENMDCRGLSKGGRRVHKWVASKLLSNPRPRMSVEPVHVTGAYHATRDDAAKTADHVARCIAEMQKEKS